MSKMTIFAVIICLLAFKESFILGVALLIYFFVDNYEYRHLKMGYTEAVKRLTSEKDSELKKKEQKIQSMLDEDDDNKQIDETFKEPTQMPLRFVNYSEFIIEDYGGWYIVKYPDMKSYPKMFMNIIEAQKVIDRLKLDYTPPKQERSKIHNVRFVR